MDDDDHYGPNHLTDLITAHTYSNTDITGKVASISYLEEFALTVSRSMKKDSEQYHSHVSGATITATRQFLNEFRFLRKNRRVDTTLLERALDNSRRVYIVHPYGFIVVRRDAGHTWQVDGYHRFVTQAVEVEDGVSALFLSVG
jgi:hypothetical protein